MANAETPTYLFFVGSYAEPSGPGIYAFSLDGASGKPTLLSTASGLKNPSFLSLDHAGRRLYSIEEVSEGGGKGGAAVAFSFEPDSGRMTRLNEEKTLGSSTCHIEFNAAGRYVIATSYHGGLVGMLPVLEDGRLGPLADVRRHEGTGPNPVRQDRPHPHSANVSPDNRFVYVPDLGTDRIQIYRPEADGMKLIPVGEAVSAPGSGPRHMTFHPEKPYAYVINELDSTITVYLRDAGQGGLTAVQTVPTLPESFRGENTCAEIRLSPDARFLYGSNRGHDSIAVFSVEEEGARLSPVEIVPSGGKIPRNFALSPDGRFLVSAHQETGNLAVFRVDPDTGRLSDTGNRGEASKGVCVKFWHS
jgi:6-phosphogluconolactonase